MRRERRYPYLWGLTGNGQVMSSNKKEVMRMADRKEKCDYPASKQEYPPKCRDRRQKAVELACFTDMPCIIRNLTDEQVIIQMVKDNYLHIAELSEEQHHKCWGLYEEDGFNRLYPPCRFCSCPGVVFLIGTVR